VARIRGVRASPSLHGRCIGSQVPASTDWMASVSVICEVHYSADGRYRGGMRDIQPIVMGRPMWCEGRHWRQSASPPHGWPSATTRTPFCRLAESDMSRAESAMTLPGFSATSARR